MDSQGNLPPAKGTTPNLITDSLAAIKERLKNGQCRADSPDEAERERRRRVGLVANLMRQLGPRYHPPQVIIDATRVHHPTVQPCIDRVKDIGERLEALTTAGAGVVFYGSVGTGKDHLAAGLLYRAASLGITASWVSGMEVFGEFRDGMDKGNREALILEQLCEPTILCISDPLPPVGQPSAWNVQILYRVLDRRYHLLKSTWATLNIAKPEEADSRLSAPVYDRLCDGAEMVPCFWPSYRRPR